jgi:hypothetical protein
VITRRAFYAGALGVLACGRDRTAELTHARTLFSRVCVQLLGRSLGSPHCEERGCLMRDIRGKVAPLDAPPDFGDATRALLAREGLRAR